MTDKHEHLDEGTIHAWLDGELTPDESAKVESQTAACAECAALVAEARGLVAASSRVLSSLDAVPGGVIPGIDAGADQLAALRARRRETSRRWWNDRRIVAAASLVFVAGAASLVWRTAGDEAVTSRTERVVDAVQVAADSAVPVATTTPSVGEAPAREAKVEASAPVPNPAPPRVTANRAIDSTVDRKAVMDAALARGSAVAANESRRTDSISLRPRQPTIDSARVASPSTQRLAVESQMQQQGAAAPTQQSLRQRSERVQAAAPPPTLGVGARLGTVGGLAATDMAASRSCFRLRAAAPGQASSIIADTVQLLNEALPGRSDPMWYRARAAGWTVDTALVWRQVDSTTVELRSRLASNPLVVRFSIAGIPLPLAPESGERVAVAVRILCPSR